MNELDPPMTDHPRNRSRSLAMILNALRILRYVPSAAITQWVGPLRARLHAWRAAWLRCSSLQGATMRRRRALPDDAPDAHSNASNCGF